MADMLELHDPPHGIGDCTRAAVATLLGLPTHHVPHFIRHDVEAHGWDGEETWWEAMCDFLWDHGYVLGEVQPGDADLAGTPHLAAGPSPRGVNHLVAVLGSGYVHDPHPSRGGLTDVQWRAPVTRWNPDQEESDDV